MKKFTKEETMLMMLYNPGSREGLIRELAGMKVQLQPEEKEAGKADRPGDQQAQEHG